MRLRRLPRLAVDPPLGAPLLGAVLVGATLVGVAGCSSIPTRYYVLRSPATAPAQPAPVPGPAAASARDSGVVVGVPPFLVDPPYDQDRLVYRIGRESPEIFFYNYHRWAVPLAEHLPALVSDAFADLPPISRIEPVVPGRSYPYLLTGRLLYLEELDLPGEQRARTRLYLELHDRQGRLLWTKSTIGELADDAENVREIVVLMKDALRQALEGARTGLEAVLSRTVTRATD